MRILFTWLTNYSFQTAVLLLPFEQVRGKLSEAQRIRCRMCAMIPVSLLCFEQFRGNNLRNCSKMCEMTSAQNVLSLQNC